MRVAQRHTGTEPDVGHGAPGGGPGPPLALTGSAMVPVERWRGPTIRIKFGLVSGRVHQSESELSPHSGWQEDHCPSLDSITSQQLCALLRLPGLLGGCIDTLPVGGGADSTRGLSRLDTYG